MNHDHSPVNLSNEEYKLYSRHIIMPNINIVGQQRLKNAKILFIGAGGLATSALLYLVGSGIGNIGIVDDDLVEISNLHRQIIYTKKDIGRYKAASARQRLEQLNPICKLNIYIERLNEANAKRIIKSYDIIIDSTDNLNTRYILSHICYQLHKIHIYGAVSSLEGQVSVFNYQGGPNYHEIYPLLEKQHLNECSARGVLGIIPGMIGLIQATEAIKIITGIGEILSGKMLIYNSMNLSFRHIKLCNINIYSNNLKRFNKNTTYKTSKTTSATLSLHDFKQLKYICQDKLYIIDIRNPIEYHVQHIKGAINIPLNKLYKNSNLHLLKITGINKYLILYCTSKARASIASYILKQAKIRHWILQIQ